MAGCFAPPILIPGKEEEEGEKGGNQQTMLQGSKGTLCAAKMNGHSIVRKGNYSKMFVPMNEF